MRRLRARAGTVVAPGPRFFCAVGEELVPSSLRRPVGGQSAAFTLKRHVRRGGYRSGCGFAAARRCLLCAAVRPGAQGAGAEGRPRNPSASPPAPQLTAVARLNSLPAWTSRRGSRAVVVRRAPLLAGGVACGRLQHAQWTAGFVLALCGAVPFALGADARESRRCDVPARTSDGTTDLHSRTSGAGDIRQRAADPGMTEM